MQKKTLVVGVDEASAEFLHIFCEKGRTLFVGGDTEKFSLPNVTYINWNKKSRISARTLVLAVKNLAERIDECVMIFAPALVSKKCSSNDVSTFESVIDSELKSFVFLFDEVLKLFKFQGFGTFVFISKSNDEQVKFEKNEISVPCMTVQGAFENFAKGCSIFYQNEEKLKFFLVNDFGNSPVAFASWLDQTIEENKKKYDWMRPAEKHSFFSRFKNR